MPVDRYTGVGSAGVRKDQRIHLAAGAVYLKAGVNRLKDLCATGPQQCPPPG